MSPAGQGHAAQKLRDALMPILILVQRDQAEQLLVFSRGGDVPALHLVREDGTLAPWAGALTERERNEAEEQLDVAARQRRAGGW